MPCGTRPAAERATPAADAVSKSRRVIMSSLRGLCRSRAGLCEVDCSQRPIGYLREPTVPRYAFARLSCGLHFPYQWLTFRPAAILEIFGPDQTGREGMAAC